MSLIRRLSWLLAVLLLVIGVAGCKEDSIGPASKQTGQPAETEELQNNQQSQEDEAVSLTIIGDDKTGTIVATTEVPIGEDDSLLDATLAILKKRGIQYSVRGGGSTAYVEGIGNLYEFARGPMSGWEARKNGHLLSQSAGITSVEDGDVIRWVYTSNYKEEE
ncbi:MAG TPA: DUF4430 domain-containing protein [Bacillales bacterium]